MAYYAVVSAYLAEMDRAWKNQRDRHYAFLSEGHKHKWRSKGTKKLEGQALKRTRGTGTLSHSVSFLRSVQRTIGTGTLLAFSVVSAH